MSVLSKLGMLFYIVTPEIFSSVVDVPDYIGQSLPYLVFVIILEVLYGKFQSRKLHSFKDTMLSISLCVPHAMFGLLVKEMIYIPYQALYYAFVPMRTALVARYCANILYISSYQLGCVQFWFAILAVDLSYYYFHRAAHVWHVLWISHSVHHSAEYFNFAVAFRQGILPYYPGLVLAILGLPLPYYVQHSRLNGLVQFWIHTECIGRLPWFIELVFNTPSHHRMHHRPPGNCNYGGVFIIWDRLFGTFKAENCQPYGTDKTVHIPRSVVYGLARPDASFDPIFVNIQHILRMSEVVGTSSPHELTGFGLLIKRFQRFVTMMQRQRVRQSWRIVTTWSHFAPDIVYDWTCGRPWWEALFELPPDVSNVLSEDKMDTRHVSLNKDCDGVSGKPSNDQIVNTVVCDRVSNQRDIRYILSRKHREGSNVTLFIKGLVLLQFVLAAVLAHCFLHSEELLNSGFEIFGYVVGGRLVYDAILFITSVLLLQWIQFYY